MINYHIVTATTINYLKAASTATQATLYYKLKLKYKKTSQNLWFNQECIRNKITPNYIQIKTKSTSTASKFALNKAKEIWLKQECKIQFSKRYILQHYIKVIHSELTYKLHPIEFDILDDQIRSIISAIIHKKFELQSKKLEKLKSKLQSPPVPKTEKPEQNFSERVLNLTNVQFNDTELSLLSKGPKFSPELNNKNTVDILVTESILAFNKIEKTENTEMSIAKIKKQLDSVKPKSNQTDLRTINSIKHKISEHDLVITRTDKSNATAILTRGDYSNKIHQFIQSEDITEIKSDPTKHFQNKLKFTLSEINVIFSEYEKRRIINMNPTAPKLYGLIKNHKPGNPIRPVVSYINSPTRDLSIKLNSIFKDLTKFTSETSVTNSLELVQKLKDQRTPTNSFLVSFDIKNMFSNIPAEECIPIIHKILNKSNINPVISSEILSAFETCLSQTYFQFNHKFYLQNSGLPMGSPLSPLLADIFITHIEREILNSNHGKNHIHFWYRYVDDILACFKGSSRQLDNLLNFINSIHPKIQFTLEQEADNKINFLDLSILHINNSCTFKVYRKPTFTGMTIPKDSFHPNQHKMAAFNSMIHRALSLPLSKADLEDELNTIKNIATKNNFSREWVEKLINKKQKQLTFRLIYPKIKSTEQHTYITISYHGTLSEKLANILSKHNLKIAFKSQNTLSNILYNAKDKTDKFQKCGVYKLKCSDCNSIYIGQSGRNIKTRYTEHFRSYRLQKTDSSFANHCTENQHPFPDLHNTEILHYAEKGFKLNILESLEIYKHRKNQNCNLLNDQLDLFYSPLFTVIKP